SLLAQATFHLQARPATLPSRQTVPLRQLARWSCTRSWYQLVLQSLLVPVPCSNLRFIGRII
ncbi:UNVERIFIED_CONTAM: hypothetical protein NY603_34910, partial [Bacteroidetes bacterium 56_B9]